jgi:hypothetical protein
VRRKHLRPHINLSHLSTHFVCLFLYGITGLSVSNQRITDTGKILQTGIWEWIGRFLDIPAFLFSFSLYPTMQTAWDFSLCFVFP